MAAESETENKQAEIWNGPKGRGWAEACGLLDTMFQPMEALLAEAARAFPGGRALDVGCGSGATTLAAARALGEGGACVGVDISEPLLAIARGRAAAEGVPARFVLADAQTHAFEAESFDIIVSRFGVMFFDDPAAAFDNLRRAAKPGAPARLLAWRPPEENAFFTTAERAAAPFLPDMPKSASGAAGQYAFADGGLFGDVMFDGGWADIEVRPIDFACAFPARELMDNLVRLGPLGQILHKADEETRARILNALRGAFAPYVHGDEVRFTSACWLASARAPD